jgi:hypothetical protein
LKLLIFLDNAFELFRSQILFLETLLNLNVAKKKKKV